VALPSKLWDGMHPTRLTAADMNIIVNEELKAYIDPLTPQEYGSLEQSILAEGCRDALVLWGDLLVDGHNRCVQMAYN
jgi:hypothetical protein